MTLRVVSYGGGVQSNALLVLAARGEIDFSTFLFANVGDDSEHPDTLKYVRDVAMPYAAERGIPLVELRKTWRDGRDWSLYQLVMSNQRSVPIPVWMDNGAPGNRACTEKFKIKPIAAWLRRHGATKDDPAILALGISLDEFARMRTASGHSHYSLSYPLIDLRMTREDCRRVILREGLPEPPKSSCYFCPFRPVRGWQDIRKNRPDLFEKAIRLEERVAEKRAVLGRDPAYLTRTGKPLDRAVTDDQPGLFPDEEDTCESGFCMV